MKILRKLLDSLERLRSRLIKLTESSPELKEVFGLVVLVVLLLLMVLYITKPTFLNLYNLTRNLAQVKRVEESLEQRIQEINNAHQILGTLTESDLTKVRKSLPTEPDPTTYLSSLERLASSLGVKILSTSAKNLNLELIPPSYKDLKEIIISLSVSGNFENVKTFLVRLKNLARTTHIERVDIQNTNKDEISAALNLKVYYLR